MQFHLIVASIFLKMCVLRLKICSVKLRMRRAMKPSCSSSVIVPEALACLQCDYYNRGHPNKVDQSDYRKITIHFRRKLSIIIEINNITCIEINQLQPTDGTFWAQWRKCMSPERLGLMKQAKNVSVVVNFLSQVIFIFLLLKLH